MSRLANDSIAAFTSSSALPPPPIAAIATSPRSPHPESGSRSVPQFTQQKTTKKHRGLIRAVGCFFKRKCSSDGQENQNVRVPLASDASSNRMTQWLYGSQRQSMPDLPLETADPLLYQERETLASVCPVMEEEPVSKRVKQDKKPEMKNKKKKEEKEEKEERPTPETKATVSFVKAKASPTDVSELLDPEASTSNEVNGGNPLHVSFLIFGGSEVDSTFEPELRPSELDDVHGSEIRPVLQTKMPLFFSLPLAQRNRCSSAMSDRKEYDL